LTVVWSADCPNPQRVARQKRPDPFSKKVLPFVCDLLFQFARLLSPRPTVVSSNPAQSSSIQANKG